MLAAVDEIGAESAERVKAAMEGFDSVEAASSLALDSAIVAHEYWDEARRELAPMTAGEPGPAPFRRPLP